MDEQRKRKTRFVSSFFMNDLLIMVMVIILKSEAKTNYDNCPEERGGDKRYGQVASRKKVKTAISHQIKIPSSRN